MTQCPYLMKGGKKCCNKVNKDQVICDKHKGKYKNQSGGFLYEMVYPMGVSVTAATYALFKLNTVVSRWYNDKHPNKKRR